MIKVTELYGRGALFLAVGHIVAVHSSMNPNYKGPDAGLATIVTAAGQAFDVVETPEEVMALIEKVRGHAFVYGGAE